MEKPSEIRARIGFPRPNTSIPQRTRANPWFKSKSVIQTLNFFNSRGSAAQTRYELAVWLAPEPADFGVDLIFGQCQKRMDPVPRLLQDLAACHVEETNTSSEGSWKQQGTLRGSRDDVLLREFEAWPFALKGKGKATGKGSYIRFQTEIHDIGIYQWRKRNSAFAVDRLVDFTCMYKYIYIHM